MDWDQFQGAMRAVGYLVATVELDGLLVCQMMWRCDYPGCTNAAQVIQPARGLRASPVLANIFDLAITCKKMTQEDCQHN